MENIQQYIKEQKDLLEQTVREMALIKAPTGFEQKRAAYCVAWLHAQGISEVLTDECGNVIVPWNICDGKNNCMFMAHLDTVFSDETELVLKEETGRWCCPGIGDDTANAAILLLLIKYVSEKVEKATCGTWFVLDVGEEGLGNLAGSRKLMESYGERLRWVISFDLYTHHIYTSCVGSYRYKITVKTKGGHSYLDFGRKSAIAEMAALINELYCYQPAGTGHTTYNAGIISGGTSVNTIAQECSMLYEVRSDEADALTECGNHFYEALEKRKTQDVQIECNKIGERPCMGTVDTEKIMEMAQRCSDLIEEITEKRPAFGQASTDCNIPLSMGVPALCIGLIDGAGAHTLEEWIDPKSLVKGFQIAVGVFETVTE